MVVKVSEDEASQKLCQTLCVVRDCNGGCLYVKRSK